MQLSHFAPGFRLGFTQEIDNLFRKQRQLLVPFHIRILLPAGSGEQELLDVTFKSFFVGLMHRFKPVFPS